MMGKIRHCTLNSTTVAVRWHACVEHIWVHGQTLDLQSYSMLHVHHSMFTVHKALLLLSPACRR